jgi:hypothetical protein
MKRKKDSRIGQSVCKLCSKPAHPGAARVIEFKKEENVQL